MPGPRGTATVNVRIRAEGESGLPVDVFAGPDARRLTIVGTARTEEVVRFEAQPERLYWQASIRRNDPHFMNYDSGEARVSELLDGTLIEIELSRSVGNLHARVQDSKGRPIGAAMLELSRAPIPSLTRMLTGEDGTAEWIGVRSNLIAADGVGVAFLPTGYRLVNTPVVEVRRSSDSRLVDGSVVLLVDRCATELTLMVDDTRFAAVFIEKKDGSAWRPLEPPVYFEPSPRVEPSETRFADQTTPTPGTLKCPALCPGTYRVAAVALRGFLGAAIFDLETSDLSLPLVASQTVRAMGKVTGPAAGIARRMDLRILETDEDLRQLRRAVLPVGLKQDGTFEVTLPAGTRQIAFEGASSGATVYAIIPATTRVGDAIEVESVRPARLRGRLVTPDGTAIVGARVGAVAEPMDSRGRFVQAKSGIAVGAATSDDLGRWNLGPGLPGLWHLTILMAGRSPIEKVVTVEEESSDAGAIVVE